MDTFSHYTSSGASGFRVIRWCNLKFPRACRGKKKKKDDDDKDGTQEDLDETSRDSTQNDTVVDKTQADSPKTSDTPTVDLSRFRGYFR